jgi:benzoyl-CoA reductase/2-hydroxyglutaryl-CoA dehydratase subunit BcrC/BadD/HgdB
MLRYVDEPQYWHPTLTMEFPNLIQRFDSKMTRIIEKQNQGLVELVEKMVGNHGN